MVIDNAEFLQLKNDIHKIIADELDRAKVKRNNTGPWSRFAEVQPPSSAMARAIVCATEALEEEGYVTTLRKYHGENNDHRSIFINVSTTYTVHKRVLEGVDD